MTPSWFVELDLQFISSGVAARSLQDALIWLSGLTPKKTAWWGWEDSDF
jgi:hypothetical protein